MNLCRCENGHFYDKEKYAACPHCSSAGNANDGRTFAFDQTEEFAPAPAPVPAPAPAYGNPLPVSGMDANSLTVPGVGMGAPMGGGFVDEPTIPLNIDTPDFDNIPMEDPNDFPEDDDHTIGFFDEDFFADPAATPAAPKKQVAPAPVVNKVSTPCVGWLVAIGGKHIGTDFRLKVGKNYIGRGANMDIPLTEDKSVSRDKHATIVYEPKNHLYFVQPGESSSLVYKNDELVLTPMMLKAYDIITVGEVNLMFIPLCGEAFNWTALFDEMKK